MGECRQWGVKVLEIEERVVALHGGASSVHRRAHLNVMGVDSKTDTAGLWPFSAPLHKEPSLPHLGGMRLQPSIRPNM